MKLFTIFKFRLAFWHISSHSMIKFGIQIWPFVNFSLLWQNSHFYSYFQYFCVNCNLTFWQFPSFFMIKSSISDFFIFFIAYARLAASFYHFIHLQQNLLHQFDLFANFRIFFLLNPLLSPTYLLTSELLTSEFILIFRNLFLIICLLLK